MPRAARKCKREGCEVRSVGRTYCLEHTPRWEGSTRGGSTRADRKIREQVLARDPTCKCAGCLMCSQTGCRKPSTQDDHILNRARQGSESLTNRQGLCEPCHKAKVQREAQAGKLPSPPPF